MSIRRPARIRWENEPLKQGRTLVKLTEKQAAQRCLEFLPAEMVNDPEISVVRLIDLWEGAESVYAPLVTETQRNQTLIERIQSDLRHVSAAARGDTVQDLVEVIAFELNEELRAYSEIIGGLTPRRLEKFDLTRNLSRTAVYLQSTGMKGPEATLWAAACSVHLGKAPVDQGPIGLDLGTRFMSLRKPDMQSIRNALVSRVGKAYRRYLLRSREICLRVPSPDGHPLGTDPGTPWPLYHRTMQQFSGEERDSFAQFWAETESRLERNVKGKLAASHRRHWETNARGARSSKSDRDKT
jgi:hypothetical protein